MADVNLNIGQDGSSISGSDVGVGDVAGGNIVNVHAGRNRLDQLNERLDLIGGRLSQVEYLLGGNLGLPGLVRQVLDIKEVMHEIKDELEDIKISDQMEKLSQQMKQHQPLHPWTISFLVLSTVLMATAIFVALVVPRF